MTKPKKQGRRKNTIQVTIEVTSAGVYDLFIDSKTLRTRIMRLK